MTEPFPLLFNAFGPSQVNADAPAEEPEFVTSGREGVMPLFEASVRGVRSRFPHLSEADIAAPPHYWFDAALARQIALHLLIQHFEVPKRAVAQELDRSREAVNRALRTVEERLQYPEFRDAYDVMAATADEALSQGDGDD